MKTGGDLNLGFDMTTLHRIKDDGSGKVERVAIREARYVPGYLRNGWSRTAPTARQITEAKQDYARRQKAKDAPAGKHTWMYKINSDGTVQKAAKLTSSVDRLKGEGWLTEQPSRKQIRQANSKYVMMYKPGTGSPVMVLKTQADQLRTSKGYQDTVAKAKAHTQTTEQTQANQPIRTIQVWHKSGDNQGKRVIMRVPDGQTPEQFKASLANSATYSTSPVAGSRIVGPGSMPNRNIPTGRNPGEIRLYHPDRPAFSTLVKDIASARRAIQNGYQVPEAWQALVTEADALDARGAPPDPGGEAAPFTLPDGTRLVRRGNQTFVVNNEGNTQVSVPHPRAGGTGAMTNITLSPTGEVIPPSTTAGGTTTGGTTTGGTTTGGTTTGGTNTGTDDTTRNAELAARDKSLEALFGEDFTADTVRQYLHNQQAFNFNPNSLDGRNTGVPVGQGHYTFDQNYADAGSVPPQEGYPDNYDPTLAGQGVGVTPERAQTNLQTSLDSWQTGNNMLNPDLYNSRGW